MSLMRQAAEQQVDLARIGLRGEQAARRHVHDDAVDIGKLLPLGVDAVIIGIALEDEARWPAPRFVTRQGMQRRQIRIRLLLHVVEAVVERRPGFQLLLLRRLFELRLVGVFGVELLEVVGGPVDAGIDAVRASCGRKRGLGLSQV